MGQDNQWEQNRTKLATPFLLTRLGVVMRPDAGQEEEQEGATNPATARGRDNQLYLFPRMVDHRNYSRIGIARVLFDHEDGIPRGVERLGIALKPAMPYEKGSGEGAGGCEDPRVTYVEPLNCYVMTYAAVGPENAHVALAISEDLFTWRRLGLVEFLSDRRETGDLGQYVNKDAVFFPHPVLAPDGLPALAMLHRPIYGGQTKPGGVRDSRPSIWISYCPLPEAQQDVQALTRVSQHHVLAYPRAAWEAELIGAGAPPVLTPLGWLLVYHGVGPTTTSAGPEDEMTMYSAGVLILDKNDPRQILFRSSSPILVPETPDEMKGSRPNVVFPTGVDMHDNGLLDIYYGMANQRIGAARLAVPAELPAD